MIISAQSIIFGDSKTPPLSDGAMLVHNSRIIEIGDARQLIANNPGEEVHHYPQGTLLPGLIDMHIHIGTDGAPDAGGFSDYMWAICAYSLLQKAFSVGVTTVRDVGSRDGLATTLRQAVHRGYVELPRIITCNLGICMTGGHGASTYETATECDGEWEIRKAIRSNHKKGADWIKILTSEALRGEEYTQSELDAAVDECHRMGRLCAAHAGYQPSVSMCVKAGFDTIEHGTFMTIPEAQYLLAHDRTWVPTIIAFAYIADQVKAGYLYQNSEASSSYFLLAEEQYANNFKSLFDTGVRTTTGTDQVLWQAPVYPVAKECAYMVRYGITPLQAIEAATKNGAEALRLGEHLGQVKPGYIADLIVTEGNPALDISALEQVTATYQSGKLVYKK